MATRNGYSCSGTSALAPSSRSHLRLVYDSRYDSIKSNSVAREKDAPRARNTLLVAAFAMMLLVGSLSLLVANARDHAVSNAFEQANTQTIRARANDSLWSIASRYEVDGVSTYDVVQWIKAHNDLSTSAIRPGEELVVPASNT